MNNAAKIQHLYRRAGFGLSPNEYDKLDWSVDKAIKHLFKETEKKQYLKMPKFDMPTRAEAKKMGKKALKELRQEARKLTAKVNADWLRQMMDDKSSPLQEKMLLFWHGHFACESKFFHFAVNQMNTIREHALGSFRDLVLAISKDASMIFYLNNQQNRKSHPNENYARELMELFTIGRGNYTEKDIKEAARAFTGWFANRLTGEFEFRERAHDSEEKTFMGKTGNFDGTDIIDIILEQEATAEFIARKVYRYFVNEKVNEPQVKALAKVFRDSDYHIGKMMRYLFEQDWFYKHRGTRIKSPIEFLVSMSKTLGLTFLEDEALVLPQRILGQMLFRPPNVAGWAGGKRWIDNATLMMRLNFAAMVFERTELTLNAKKEPRMMGRNRAKKLAVKADLSDLIRATKKINEADLGDYLAGLLLPNYKQSMQDSFVKEYVQYRAKTKEEQVQAWLLGIMSLPEYQMC